MHSVISLSLAIMSSRVSEQLVLLILKGPVFALQTESALLCCLYLLLNISNQISCVVCYGIYTSGFGVVKLNMPIKYGW